MRYRVTNQSRTERTQGTAFTDRTRSVSPVEVAGASPKKAALYPVGKALVVEATPSQVVILVPVSKVGFVIRTQRNTLAG